ncbi:phosphoribosylanthranilate isomerase [Desulfovermiculus halophilus]|uniref:phosphoribosylanthranilate isomerase n=1 Tax=Desulfovermiculus halophilus TaxID=339722 RepID=UPI0006878563|nr:phosphoribosylanthranilate isomerase [Desulfovermiculus halophilus]
MKVKVCGLTRAEDVAACARLGIDLIGFIFHPQSPRFVRPEQAGALPRGTPGRVGVFVRQSQREISACMRTAGLDLAQLHGGQSPGECLDLGPERVLKVLWPQGYPHARAMQEDLERFAPVCSAFVLDSGLHGGGHGRTIDMTWIADLAFPRPWFLAGGLTPDNLEPMLQACRPDGVDLNSGVEHSPGIKNHKRIEQCLGRLGARTDSPSPGQDAERRRR